MSHGNEMICQPMTLSGDAEWPKVADAVIEAEKAMVNCRVYLDEHRGRTAYQKLRRGGYPFGSGGIESSNKFMYHVRLKRSGAWWYEINSNQMLALRCAKYNGSFDQVFARYQQRLRIA